MECPYTCTSNTVGYSPQSLQDTVSLQSFIMGANHPFLAPLPPARLTRFQYDCTNIARYPPAPTPPFFAIHHTMLVVAISCKGQYSPQSSAPRRVATYSLAYMLNMRGEEYNTGFYSYVARFRNTVTLDMYMFLSNTGFTRRNTLLIFVWLRPRNT